MYKLMEYYQNLPVDHPTKRAVKQHLRNDDHISMIQEVDKGAKDLGISLSAAGVIGIAAYLLKALLL